MFRQILAATSIVVILAGCAGSGGDPDDNPDDPSATSSQTSAPPSRIDEATSCLASGPWHLDTADFADQGLSHMQSTGIPATALETSGDQTIEFTSDGLMSMATNLTQHAVIVVDITVNAIITRTDEASSDWAWTDDQADRITFENFEWLVENTSGTATTSNGITVPVENFQFPSFDFGSSGPIIVSCTDSGMSLQSSKAPLVAYFKH